MKRILRIRKWLIVLLSCIAAAAAFAQVNGGRPAEITFRSSKMTLHGYLYKPEGAGPFPAVLWNHGSEKLPGWLPQLGPLFVEHGYVFFIPHRRGQGRSAEAAPYIMDLLSREGLENGRAARDRLLVRLQEEHLEDQIAALDYLKSQAYVDVQKMAVMGCSFGGIQTMLAAEKGLGLRAAVNFAGAAQTWQDSPELRERLRRAARNAVIPVIFVQAANDYDTSPSRELAREMGKLKKPYQVKIYPHFGGNAQQAHELCVRGANVWSNDVFAFLSDALKQ